MLQYSESSATPWPGSAECAAPAPRVCELVVTKKELEWSVHRVYSAQCTGPVSDGGLCKKYVYSVYTMSVHCPHSRLNSEVIAGTDSAKAGDLYFDVKNLECRMCEIKTFFCHR